MLVLADAAMFYRELRSTPMPLHLSKVVPVASYIEEVMASVLQ